MNTLRCRPLNLRWRRDPTKFRTLVVQGMILVTIVIPTFRRPALLTAAIESCQQQSPAATESCEILVVDNSPEGSARGIVEMLAVRSLTKLRYVHEARSGIARARNTGVAAASGRFIAFLDDDEVAAPGWLASLLRHAANGGKAVFGPVQPSFETGVNAISASAIRLFKRALPVSDGADISRMNAFLGAGNSLFEKATCFLSDAPFTTELDGLGGEDSDFIFHLVQRGVALIWAADAIVTEFVPNDRMASRYLELRSLRNGQIRSLVQFRAKGQHIFAGLCWMAVGLAQTGLFGLAGLTLAPFSPNTAADYRLRAMSGLGKMFWMPFFWPRSYPSNSATAN